MFTSVLSILETNNIVGQQRAANNELDEGTIERKCKKWNNFLGGRVLALRYR